MSYELYRRPGSDSWYYDVTVAGVRERKSARTTNKKLAEDIASKREWELRSAAVHGTESVMTFGAATGLYLDAGKSARFLAPLFTRWEHRKVKDIKPGTIQQLARDLYPKAGPATWNRQVITPAQAVINHAAELGYVPHIRVKRFKSPKAIRRAADRAWLDRFREHASPEIATLALFMFQGAARIGEAINLSWDDVNLRERRVTIRKTKNGDPHTINLTAELVAALANLTKDGGKVFKFAARWSVYGSWRRACKKAGIEYIPPHQAGRHAFATEMIARNGIDVGTTAKLGNWKSVKLLLDNYVHAENDAAVIESVFGTPTAHKRGKALK